MKLVISANSLSSMKRGANRLVLDPKGGGEGLGGGGLSLGSGVLRPSADALSRVIVVELFWGRRVAVRCNWSD